MDVSINRDFCMSDDIIMANFTVDNKKNSYKLNLLYIYIVKIKN